MTFTPAEGCDQYISKEVEVGLVSVFKSSIVPFLS